MKLKTVEVNGATYAVVSDGKPVFVEDDGTETPIDVANTKATIARLNGEAKGHREAKEAAEAKLKGYEGISDPKAALDAMSKLANIDAKKLIDAGEVERVKSEIAKVYDEKLTAAEKRALDLESSLYAEKIGGAFARSAYVKDKLAIPADFVQARFGSQFKLEDGKVVAYDATGNKIYSKSRPGELAAFDEALEFVVQGHADRDHILKGSGHSGGGAQPGKGQPGAKTMTRAEFDKMSQSDRSAKMRDGFKISD